MADTAKALGEQFGVSISDEPAWACLDALPAQADSTISRDVTWEPTSDTYRLRLHRVTLREDGPEGPAPRVRRHSAGHEEVLFQRELQLAEEALDRDSKVRHLRKALSCRPDHPDNIVIEFRIGIELD